MRKSTESLYREYAKLLFKKERQWTAMFTGKNASQNPAYKR